MPPGLSALVLGRRTATDLSSYMCCKTRVDPLALDAAVDRLIEYALEARGRSIHLCNAYTLSLASHDPAYAAILNRGDCNLPDGTPLAWMGHRLGFDIDGGHRPRGADFVRSTLDRGRALGLRHYFYGSTPEVVTDLVARLSELEPRVDVVGAESPPFRPLTTVEEQELIGRIRESAPHVVWVGLGTPRQDEFVEVFRDRLGTTLVAVGAAFDFLAGSKHEAPGWMRRHGLEWTHRLATEPSRLWRRYLVGNAAFVAGVLTGGVATR